LVRITRDIRTEGKEGRNSWIFMRIFMFLEVVEGDVVLLALGANANIIAVLAP
jgi:hypothetical protein